MVIRNSLASLPGLVGLLILGAWAFDIESVQRLGLASVSMNPMTAACFVAISFAAVLILRSASPVECKAAFALCALVSVVAALKLIDAFTNAGIGVDTILFASKLEASQWFPSRMAPNTALCFLLISLAMVLTTRAQDGAVVTGQLLAIGTGVVSLFALLGYFYGVTAFYNVPAFIPMAAHTAACFLCVAGAVLAIAPARGVMRPLSDDGVAGRSARLLLPVAMVGPLLLGVLRLGGERAGLFPSEVGVALMITATVLLLAAVIWWNSRSLLDLDKRRVTAEADLRSLNEDLESRVATRTSEIERGRRFLSALLANMQDGLIVNRGGRIVFANEACVRLIGAANADQVLGRSPIEFVHDDFKALSVERAKMLRAGPGQLPVIEERLVRLDGTTIDVEVMSASFVDDGDIVTFAMLRDVTTRKAMQQQLQRAQRLDAVGQLTGGIAHDFNNLLAVVIGNLDLMEADLSDRPQTRELAEMALTAALRGADLTRQLLAFSRRQSLDPKKIEVNPLVTETTQMLKRTLGEKIDVRVRLGDDLWPAVADPAQVESALANLAINARDAMPNGGRLTFETANKRLDEYYCSQNVDVTPGDYVMIAVSDTGTGIAPDILAQVFEPFFTTKPEGKGSGLGLSMIYGFAKQSRGHVRIYSEVGHGTTVRLYLPRAVASAAAQDDVAGETTTAARNATILVVEDNPDVRRVAVGQLSQMGYTVVEADSGPAAVDILSADQPVDLVFTDIIMPGGMTGIELAKEAPKIRPGVKVLLTSGFAEASVTGARPEDMPLLSKPYRQQDLARKIHDVLQGVGAR